MTVQYSAVNYSSVNYSTEKYNWPTGLMAVPPRLTGASAILSLTLLCLKGRKHVKLLLQWPLAGPAPHPALALYSPAAGQLTACFPPLMHCAALYPLHCTALQFTALHCNSLHCTATHCTELFCSAVHWTIHFKGRRARGPAALFLSPYQTSSGCLYIVTEGLHGTRGFGRELDCNKV